jgi:hypothetical protein
MNRWLALTGIALWSCSSQEPAVVHAEPAASSAEPRSLSSPREDEGHASNEQAGSAPGAQRFPLKEWMVANLNRPLRTDDFDALARSLATAASYAPHQFADWSRIAQQGAKAAAAHDMVGVRASCSECHDRYRTEYKNTMRTQLLNRIGSEGNHEK